MFVTHGATAAYTSVLDAFVNPGDRVVLFDPCSPLFSLGARSRRADVRWVPTSNENGRCRYSPKLFEYAMRRAKLLVLAVPANPTGACFGPEDLDHIVKLAARYDVLVFSDESFRSEGCSLATLAGGERRVLTAGSVSQGWGLGSVRVGWLAGPRHLVKACALTANLHAPYVPTLCQQIAARALAEPIESADRYREKRQYALDSLRGLRLEPECPAAGYFLWLPVAGLGLTGRAFAERLLKEQRVLVGPGCAFGPSGVNHVRISLAIEDGRLREGLSRFAAFVRSLRGESPAAEPRESRMEEVVDSLPVFSRA